MAEHQMQPPPELVGKLAADIGHGTVPDWLRETIYDAYAAGADAQLEKCVQWLGSQDQSMGKWIEVTELQSAMRPKPVSLKDRSLALISRCIDPDGDNLDGEAIDFIRRALEALPDDQ